MALQKAVWSAYVVGQEERKDPSEAYVTAAKAAIAAVDDARAPVERALVQAIDACDLTRVDNGAPAETWQNRKRCS